MPRKGISGQNRRDGLSDILCPSRKRSPRFHIKTGWVVLDIGKQCRRRYRDLLGAGDVKEERPWTEIDLSNLRHNPQQIKGILPQGCRIMAVVKADAYGHGAVRIASELQKMGGKD